MPISPEARHTPGGATGADFVTVSSRIEAPALERAALPRLSWLRSAVQDNGLFARITLGYAASWVVVSTAFDLPPTIQPRLVLEYVAVFGLLFMCFTGIAASVLRLRAERSGVPEVLRPYCDREALATALIAVLLCAFLAALFTTYKMAIPRLHPFAWDAMLMRLDQQLHGRDPWRLLQPVAGYRVVTAFLSVIYGPVWFFAGASMIGWMAWSRNRPLRRRFFLSYALLWIALGTVAAVLMSSAGPPYYSLVHGGENPYAELMAYLNERAPWVVQTQLVLWKYQSGGVTLPGTGISAAPSLHVAQLALFAFFSWKVHPVVGRIMAVLTVLTLIATVHLGWHYAVDGYLGVIGAYLVFRLANRIDRGVERLAGIAAIR